VTNYKKTQTRSEQSMCSTVFCVQSGGANSKYCTSEGEVTKCLLWDHVKT